jgi:tetratricopeptide (TPR) repeat protein
MGHAAEGSQWLQKLIIAVGVQSPPLALGRAHLGLSVLLIYISTDQERVKAGLEKSIRLLEGVNDREGVAFALYMLANCHPDDKRVKALVQEGTFTPWRGNRIGLEWAVYFYLHWRHFWEAYQGYGELIDRVIASAAEKGDQQLLSLALIDKGFSAMYRNDMQAARALMEQALGIARSVSAHLEETLSLYRLGEIMELTGDLDSSQRCMEEALRLAERNSWPDNEKTCPLSILGKVARDRGDYRVARNYFARSLQYSLPDFQWWGLEGMSCVAAALGQHVRAARLLGAVEADRHRRNDPWWVKDKLDLAPYIAMSRASLGDEAYGAAYAEGQAMSLTEAKAYALAESD